MWLKESRVAPLVASSKMAWHSMLAETTTSSHTSTALLATLCSLAHTCAHILQPLCRHLPHDPMGEQGVVVSQSWRDGPRNPPFRPVSAVVGDGWPVAPEPLLAASALPLAVLCVAEGGTESPGATSACISMMTLPL